MEQAAVTFTNRPEPDDFARAVYTYYLRRRSFWVSMGGILLILLAMWALITWMDGWQGSLCLVFLFGVLATGLTAIILFGYVPWALRRQAQKHERMTAETTWELSEERVHVTNRFGESRFDWGTYGEVLEDERLILLLYAHNRRLFQVIPKRSFLGPEELAAALRMLNEHIGKQK